MKRHAIFNEFHPIIAEWFVEQIGSPSPPQLLGWPKIADKRNVLISAPTGSGKTLAAFLKCLDFLYKSKEFEQENQGIRVVYVSPLKALNNDIYRNLEVPIQGIHDLAAKREISWPQIKVDIRTGDTSQKERRQMLKRPPDILITTPESLYIMLTTKRAREMFSTVEYVIVDEIHSVIANKRGVHLSLTLERLEELSVEKIVRIGLSATMNPIEKVASYLGGFSRISEDDENSHYEAREVDLINCQIDKQIDLNIEVPVKDLRSLQETSIWPDIFQQLVELIEAHRSTLIFVNNRRHAEQVAKGINSLLDHELIKTHHGSMSKEVRRQLEADFKRGHIRCLVATSTLELGIDIGHIDLVVQVGAPSNVSQLIQRIGRSGHTLGAISKGYVIPKTRADLLRAAFMGYEVGQYQMEYTNIPDHCLDVLAQQITSIVCEEERDAEELFYLIKSSYAYRDLSYEQYEKLIIALAYPAPPDEPGSIKPRIMYDRITRKIRGTKLGRMLALLGAGTIPDKGYYAVYEKGTNLRVGELEEEFVFETRLGERFFLGSSVWKLEAVKKDRVIVSQTHGSGGKLPFWKGDPNYWTYETGKRFAQFLGDLEKQIDTRECLEWLRERCSLGEDAAINLQQYVKEQINNNQRLHSDKQIICEYFGDEVGSRRIMIHSPFGGKVNGPLAIVLQSCLTKLLDHDIEFVYTDEGILFHIIGHAVHLENIFSLLSPTTIKEALIRLLPATPLFSMNLRYNLNRALLVNAKQAGKRVPLWIQRLRSAEVAQSISKFSDHPIIVETYRECLNDLFDLDSLVLLLKEIVTGQIQVIDLYTKKPSPFTSEISFNFWQIFQYVEDLPIAERRNQLLLTDQSVLDLALGADGEYELIDPQAIDLIKAELEKYRFNRKINNSDDLYYYIYSFGELAAENYTVFSFNQLNRTDSYNYLRSLEAERRILRISLQDGQMYWVAVEDLALYLQAFDLDLEKYRVPIGSPEDEKSYLLTEWLPAELLTAEVSTIAALTIILRRYLRFQTPFTLKEIQKRYQITDHLLKRVLNKLISQDDLVILKKSEDDHQTIYCNSKVYDRIKQKTIELARKDIQRKENDVYLTFLFRYQGISEEVVTGEEQLKRLINKFQGLYLPVSWWEKIVFPARINNYYPRMLDYLCSTGAIRWVGRMNNSRREVAFFSGESFFTHYYVDQQQIKLTKRDAEIYRVLQEKPSAFLYEYAKLLKLSSTETLEQIENLVWKGLLTNDQFAPLRFYEENSKSNSAWKKYKTIPEMGRWALIDHQSELSTEENLLNYLEMLLNRYGILAKEIVQLEKADYSWGDIYVYLKAREFTSGIKRGLFVSGFSGIQFAQEETIEELRLVERLMNESPKSEYVTISASDPANLHSIVSQVTSTAKIKRHPGTVIVFKDGEPVLAVKGYGKVILSYTEEKAILRKAIEQFVLAFQAKRVWADRDKILSEFWGEEDLPIKNSPVAAILEEFDYNSEYNGLALWRKL